MHTFTMQPCTARYLWAFPEDVAKTPSTIVAVSARQLDMFAVPARES